MLLRYGGISLEELRTVCDLVEVKKVDPNKPNAPGQLLHHYAPQIPIKFINEVNFGKINNKKIGALFFKKRSINYKFTQVEILSEKGDLREAAANLFFHLHELETKNLDMIVVEPIKQEGLGIAIMDRLTKATNRYK
jgi:L-threonylcarbamoyladenylate synthase